LSCRPRGVALIADCSVPGKTGRTAELAKRGVAIVERLWIGSDVSSKSGPSSSDVDALVEAEEA
jgi:hypothetical protein